jgi:hypothetical protein
MRDPELILRAQRAATELERAWDRWRTMHGLDTEPLPPVSSYVGYSLEEPWGQPRVVFGIAAAEAEHLAALLDRHDCAGPVYAAMTSHTGRGEIDAGARVADPDRDLGRLHVPTQVQAGVAARDLAADTAPAGGRLDPLGPAEPTDIAGPGPAAGVQGSPAGYDLPGAGEPDGLVAFRPRHEPASYQDEDGELVPPPDEAAEDDQPAQDDDAGPAGRPPGGWARRLSGGHALPRQKRTGGAAKGSGGGRQEGKERADLADMAADLAGWAAGELPGQASHRRPPRPPARPDRPGVS